MLISLSDKFVFIAGFKTASTAIEEALRPYSQVVIVDSKFGKHLSAKDIQTNFAPLLSLVNPLDMLVFSVVRDPVDFLISLYTSHQDPKFKEENPSLYTGDLEFQKFLNEWVVDNSEMAKPQYLRLLDSNGCILPNYIISYDKLNEGIQFIADHINVNHISLKKINGSYIDSVKPVLSSDQITWIEERFSGDRMVLADYCNRSLSSQDRLFLSTTLKRNCREDLLVPDFVRALYSKLMLRHADVSGLNDYVAAINNGWSAEEVVESMLRSQEFHENYKRFSQVYGLGIT